MRLLEVKQALLEARSITDVLITEPERAAAFLKKIKDKVPFPVKVKGSDNIEVVAVPSEYKRLQALIAGGDLKGQKLIATDGESYNLNNLVKTKELVLKLLNFFTAYTLCSKIFLRC